jgi:hypothetical protein
LSLILVQAAAIKSQAQYFMAGPKLGIQAYTIRHQLNSTNEQFDPKIKLGFNAGVEFNIPLATRFNLNPEINYSQKGRKIYAKETGWTLNEIHHYVEFPLILNYQMEARIKKLGPLKNIGPFTWFFGIGPNLSYLLGGSGTLETSGGSVDYKISFGGNESDYQYITFSDVNRWQWGLDFNLGVISPLKNNKNLVTTLRFSYGHTQLGGEDGSQMPILGFTDNLAHHYMTLNFSVAYLFGMDVGLLRKGKSTKGQKIKTKNVGGKSSKPKNINRIKRRKN